VLNPDGSTHYQEKILTFSLCPSIADGTRICFQNEGDQALGVIPSDLVFKINLLEHKQYRILNSNLILHYILSTEEASSSETTITIITLDKRVLNISVQGPVQNGTEKIVKNEGMPTLHNGKGDLIIKFFI